MSKYIIMFLFAFVLNGTAHAQDMDNKELYDILYSISDDFTGEYRVEDENVNWQFEIDSVKFICNTDLKNNRMRIVSPIEGTINLDPESVKACLEANFESVMSTRYAVYQDFVWSVFTHPLKSLSRERVLAATSQVYSSVKTFGTHYSCSLLEIPNRDNK